MECPDKLEPQYLTSVLKNVPVELMWHLREYHSKPSHFEIKWRARQPVEGKKYGYGGDLKWEDARSGDMYVRDRSLEQKYQHLQDAHCVLRSEYDDLNDVHRSLSKEYNDLMQDHCDGYTHRCHAEQLKQSSPHVHTPARCLRAFLGADITVLSIFFQQDTCSQSSTH